MNGMRRDDYYANKLRPFCECLAATTFAEATVVKENAKDAKN